MLAVLGEHEALAPRAVGGRPAHPDVGGVEDHPLGHGAEVSPDVGHGAQAHAVLDGAAPRGQERADLADGPGDRRAVDAGPGGQHVVGHAAAQADQGGQEAVDEDQLVLGAGTDGAPPAGAVGQTGVLAGPPLRADPGHELGQHWRRQAGGATIRRQGGTVPGAHTSDRAALLAPASSPAALTVHEVVRGRPAPGRPGPGPCCSGVQGASPVQARRPSQEARAAAAAAGAGSGWGTPCEMTAGSQE